MTITRKRRKEYIDTGGRFCVHCESEKISAGKVESKGREAWQPVVCYDCGCEWNDIFRLIGVDDIRLPENGSRASSNPKQFKRCKWRNSAFILGKGARLFQYLLRLLVAGREVIRAWENGDLAAAVRNLEAAIREVERFLRRIRLKSRFASSRMMSKNLKK